MSERRGTVRVDPLVSAVPASFSTRLAALALNAVVPLLFVIVGVVALTWKSPYIAWGSALLAAAAAAVPCVMVARTGRSLGNLATGTRTVDRSTGAAPWRSFASTLFTGRLGTFDLRRGRDPFAPALPPLTFPSTESRAPQAAQVSMSHVAPTAELDSGERFSLARPIVLGRSPVMMRAGDAEPHQWADLSRTLSKSHARLEWDGSAVWVTDLGSTNGTALRTRGGTQPLAAHQRTRIPMGVTLLLGERVVRIREPDEWGRSR